MTLYATDVYPENRLSILYVDDEETSLKHFKDIFGEKFTVFTASNGEEGLKLLEENKDSIGILMTDQRMPGEKGTQVLEKVREDYPHILRILITAYADLEAMCDAVNSGGIYKYVVKPWDIPKLESILMKGLAIFALREIRNQLIREKVSILKGRMVEDHYQNLQVFTSMLSRYLHDPVSELKVFIDGVSERGLEERFNNKASKAPDDWTTLLGPVSAQVDRISLILSKLDEASKESKREAFHQIRIQEVVSHVIDLMKPRFQEERIEITNNIPEDLCPIMAAPEMMHQLFELLLEDEILSMPGGGKIWFSAKSISGTTDEPVHVQIKIEDDRSGLGKEFCGPLFEPFHIRSQDPKELGLNLWICFFIVHNHGGQIKARNNQSGGTSFMITMPSVSDESRPISEKEDFFAEIVWNEAVWEYLLTDNFNEQLLGCIVEGYHRE